MTERRAARRYELSLPVVVVRASTSPQMGSRSGKTRDISTRGVYFIIDQELAPGTELDFTLTMPPEITRGTEVFIRAHGRVVRLEKKQQNGTERTGVAAVIEKYDIVRAQSS